MNVTDIPQQAKREDYDEAAARYAELVRSRAISVYQVGNVRFPGLSDLDLLVVTDRTAIDNRYFYSAHQRMPRRLVPLFLHEPFVLPAWSLRVLCHTTHGSPKLLAGRDVLSPYVPDTSANERWCRLLEAYCSYASYAVRVTESGTLKGRMAVAASSAFRYLLADTQAVLEYGDPDKYAAEIDAVRAAFFDRGEPEKHVLDIYAKFESSLRGVDARVREAIGVSKNGDALAVARALLHGERESGLFDREYAFRRARDIDGYHRDLASLGFPYGHLFFIAAYPGAVRRADSSLVNEMVRNLYRVRRRIEEYSGA